jgi:DNA-binding protein YbaB
MRIEDRMSLWAAKKPRDEVSELLLEGAQEIADLRRQREEDGKQMGALIAGYQKMQGLCIDGKYLTDEERAAVEWCVEMALNSATDCVDEIRTLRGLLERLP